MCPSTYRNIIIRVKTYILKYQAIKGNNNDHYAIYIKYMLRKTSIAICITYSLKQIQFAAAAAAATTATTITVVLWPFVWYSLPLHMVYRMTWQIILYTFPHIFLSTITAPTSLLLPSFPLHLHHLSQRYSSSQCPHPLPPLFQGNTFVFTYFLNSPELL